MATDFEKPELHFHVPVSTLKVVSRREDGRVYKVIGAVPGTIGYAPDGSARVIYTAESHKKAKLYSAAILDINHEQQAVVGRLISKDTDEAGNLIIEFEVDPKYSYISNILDENLQDGVSIEAAITDYSVDEKQNAYIANEYILTGLAVVLATKPSCAKSQCKLIAVSTAFPGLLKHEHSPTTIIKEGNFMADSIVAAPVAVVAPEAPKIEVLNEAPKVEASAPATPAPTATTAAPVTPPVSTPNKVEAEALRKEMTEHKTKMEAEMAVACKAFEAKIALLEAQSLLAVKAKEEAVTKLAGAQKELVVVSSMLGEYKARVLADAKKLVTPKILEAASTLADISKDTKLEDLTADKLLKVVSFAEKASGAFHSTEGAGAVETNKAPFKPEVKRDPLETNVGWLTKVLQEKRMKEEKARLEASRLKKLKDIEDAEAKK